MKYYKKELISNKVYLPTGGMFPFDNVGDDTGIWATDDPFLIAEAEKIITRGVGGIGEISKEDHDELSKKKIGGPLAQSWNPAPPATAFQVPQRRPDPRAVLAADKPAPITVPQPDTLRRRASIGRP